MSKLMYAIEGEVASSASESGEQREEAFAGSEALQRVLQRLDAMSGDVLRRTFLARALQGLEELTRQLDDDRLGEVTSASSDLEVLLAALEQMPEAPVDEEESLWLKARLRGRKQKEVLLNAEGGVISSAQMGELLEISRQAVDQRRRKGELLALQPGGRRAYRYPLWQVDNGGILSGLSDVLSVLEGHDPWMTLQFFLRENIRLDGNRPLDVLRREEAEGLNRVLDAAKSYGEHGGD